ERSPSLLNSSCFAGARRHFWPRFVVLAGASCKNVAPTSFKKARPIEIRRATKRRNRSPRPVIGGFREQFALTEIAAAYRLHYLLASTNQRAFQEVEPCR